MGRGGEGLGGRGAVTVTGAGGEVGRGGEGLGGRGAVTVPVTGAGGEVGRGGEGLGGRGAMTGMGVGGVEGRGGSADETSRRCGTPEGKRPWKAGIENSHTYRQCSRTLCILYSRYFSWNTIFE